MEKKQAIFITGMSLILLFIAACGPSKEQLTQKISSLEEKVKKDIASGVNSKSIEELVNAYNKYSEDFPEDEKTPDYLFKSAQYSLAINNAKGALENYQKLYDKYPNHPKAAECLFMQAFLYENQLNDLKKAKELYETFIAKYPQHQLIQSAQFALANLGKTPEQLAKEFEAKAAQNDSLQKISTAKK